PEDKNIPIRSTLLSYSVFFLLGVSLVFISLGIGASFVGKWIQNLLVGDSGLFIQRIAGIFIIVMGLFVGGWLHITALMKERRFQSTKKRAGYLGTFLL